MVYAADVFHFDLRLSEDIPDGSWDEFLAISTSTTSTVSTPSTLAGRLAKWVHGLNASQVLVIRQREPGVPWHWHITVRLTRTYKSTYKWWKKDLDELELVAPALEAGPHDDWRYRVGYCQEDDTQIVHKYRISDEYMAESKEYYQLMKKRHKIRDFKRKLITIPREQLPAVVEAAEVEFATTRHHALEKLAEAGFAFSGMEVHGAWAKRFRAAQKTGADE